jgi:hypothetical protein
MPLRSSEDIDRDIQEAGRRIVRVRQAAERLRGAQTATEPDVSPRPVTIVQPPPSPLREQKG